MALNEVNFITLQGGLGRTLAGDDAVSGLVLPAATSLADPTFVVGSLGEAIALGIEAGNSDTGELYYHIASFFEQVSAPLYVRQSTGDFAADLEALQSLADGTIKQVAVVVDTFAAADIAELNSAVVAQQALKRGLSALYCPNSLGESSLSTLPTLATQNAENVSVILASDAAAGFCAAGTALGCVARALVSEDIAWVRKFNVAATGKFQDFAVGGMPYRSIPTATLNTLNTKRYVFLRRYVGFAGAYFSSAFTATASTSDYATIENCRTMEKAKRSIRTALVPELASPLFLQAGKLRQDTLAKFDLLVRNRLDQMKNEQEISEFDLFIDPAQNVLSTSTLEVQVSITPVGVASSITVKIGFSL